MDCSHCAAVPSCLEGNDLEQVLKFQLSSCVCLGGASALLDDPRGVPAGVSWPDAGPKAHCSSSAQRQLPSHPWTLCFVSPQAQPRTPHSLPYTPLFCKVQDSIHNSKKSHAAPCHKTPDDLSPGGPDCLTCRGPRAREVWLIL